MRTNKSVGFLSFLCILLLWSCDSSNSNTEKLSAQIIPEPKSMEVGKGRFEFNKNTKIVVPDSLKAAAEILIEKFTIAAGWQLEITSEKPEENYLVFKLDQELGEESYHLEADRNSVKIKASALPGFVYGIQSLRQLLPVEIEADSLQNVAWKIPEVTIDDSPQYSYRGSHLDVSRHFFGKEYIKKHLDRMAFFKLNTFHFHLVDDQGWRIEIKKYPKLTEVGGFRVNQEDKHWNARTENAPGEEATYGGYYTQETIKEIVAYAQEKGIQVIPEIEMPAHVMSAIAAYPWLSCKEEQIAVPSGGVWPITDIYCAGKESTFDFQKDVLTEVMALFPGEYIHVGGDEATKTNWETCSHCQGRIKEEGLAGTDELQSYFMKRIEKFLNKSGKTLIGWDEILEGGLPEEATVMSWRGTEGGWEASAQGHDVIMTPVSHMYFDYYQGSPDNEPVAFNAFTPLKQVYDFSPVLDSMSVEQKEHILGAQANLWTEYVATESHSEYMLFPRLAALAEVVWSPEEKHNWKNFSVRIRKMMQRFEVMGINYAKSAYAVQSASEIDLETGEITIALKSEFSDTEIRYALGDSALTAASKIYKTPIKIDASSNLTAAVFENGEIMGAVLDKEFSFHKAVAKPLSYQYPYNDSYKGGGKTGLVDVLKGSKYFKDGRWQGWFNRPAIITIDLEEATRVSKVIIGSLEEQGTGIYFPQELVVEVSKDDKNFEEVAKVKRDYQPNPAAKIENFEIRFEPRKAVQFVRVSIQPLTKTPKGGSAWLFLDEIQVK